MRWRWAYQRSAGMLCLMVRARRPAWTQHDMYIMMPSGSNQICSVGLSYMAVRAEVAEARDFRRVAALRAQVAGVGERRPSSILHLGALVSREPFRYGCGEARWHVAIGEILSSAQKGVRACHAAAENGQRVPASDKRLEDLVT